jgi:hypothetical protein
VTATVLLSASRRLWLRYVHHNWILGQNQ